MHTYLAFFPRPEGGTIKVSREWVEASDWFVLFTLGTLLFLLGAFAMWAWLIWRRTTKPEPHIKLLMELEEESEVEARTRMQELETETRAPWEQTPDWWKKVDP
ncbi:hypothetical protein [Prosthecobacter sp.]|jgi:hypothetical protein|uniref:hypothetical protein n=1 Tax=Prosthecobacter sp. TaxID=1965333 RepID=UPI0037C8EF30